MEEYLRRLANHANLSAYPEDSRSESLLLTLWDAGQTKIFPDIKPLCDDILLCLEKANLDVNGSHPSETITPAGGIPRSLALCVSEIVHRCNEYVFIWEQESLFTATDLKLLKQISWMIMDAWCCILHGDIDDIASDVQLSGWIKEIL